MKIGILGAGQLARMLSLAAFPLGFKTLCFDPCEEPCAGDVTTVIRAEYSDEKALKNFIDQVDIVTFETENIPDATAEFIQKYKPLFPSLDILKVAQDRFFEKNLFQKLEIPTAEYFKIDSLEELQKAVKSLGFPAVLKTRRFGYDGKGQFILKSIEDVEKTWALISDQAIILEKWIPFQREISIIAARNSKGEIQFYPLCLNEHKNGILHLTQAPYQNLELEKIARSYAQKILEHFKYVGVLTIEFFCVDGKLLANEMAPRVHNSGHWTIEGAECSQFENHLRAITDLPLGSTQARGQMAMLNSIGSEPDLNTILEIPGAHYHSYGKSPRPLRKLGHVTLLCQNNEEYSKLLEKLKPNF